jgi:hypothetical protein
MPHNDLNFNGSPNTPYIQEAQITSVDVVNGQATATTRFASNTPVDISHYVGSVGVTPTVGEAWYIAKIRGVNRLHARIPTNDPNQGAIMPTQGQHVVGSGQGPVELNAGPSSTINAHSPLSVLAVSTATRPTGVPAGTHVFDTTISKPIWYTGSAWVDGSGTAV